MSAYPDTYKKFIYGTLSIVFLLNYIYDQVCILF